MVADFSIVTPSFNQAQFVRRTIESVQTQKGVTVQHVVVDPGSTDGSQEIIRSFPGITFVEKPDRCQSEGINNGFSACQGRFVAWLNSDDMYPSDDVLSKVRHCFDANPDVDVVYGNAIFVDANDKFIKNYYVNGRTQGLGLTFEYQVGICQPAVFWRREVYQKLGGLDESLDFQLDYEYWIRFHQAGKVWHHLDAVLAAHRWWDGMKTASKRQESLRESLNLVKQRFGYVHTKWAARLAALEVDSSDGIINVSKTGDKKIEARTLEILRGVNTDSATVERMTSPTATAPMKETYDFMLAAGVPMRLEYLDATSLKWLDQTPGCYFKDDATQPSIARKLELKTNAADRESYVTYAAEPRFQIAQRRRDFESGQKKLENYLASQSVDKAKTCVVVANGPSLKRSLSENLFGFDLIISNFAYKDERLLKHAKYFTIVNHTVAEQVYADWPRLEALVKVFPFWIGRHVPQVSSTYYVNSTVAPGFCPDARRNISWRSTVSYFNIQLAYSLGYRRILLVGFDNSYIQSSSVREGDEILQKQDDPNHFMAGYFKGKTWQAADTGNMNASYCEALKFSMEHDLEIVNCTVGGRLHVFPRAQLTDYVYKGLQERIDPSRGPRYKLMTPGEVALVSKRPVLADFFGREGAPQYAKLDSDARNFLLTQASGLSDFEWQGVD